MATKILCFEINLLISLIEASKTVEELKVFLLEQHPNENVKKNLISFEVIYLVRINKKLNKNLTQ